MENQTEEKKKRLKSKTRLVKSNLDNVDIK